MDEELEVLRQYVESLGLHEQSTVSEADRLALIESLQDSDEDTLAKYVGGLGNADALQDLIVNTLYG